MKGFAVACVVLAVAIIARVGPVEAVTCGDVSTNLGQCLLFLRGQAAAPTGACCDGVRRLTAMVPTAVDRRVACNCVKQAVGQIRDIKPNAVSSLPRICRAPVSFPISLGVDCARIQ